MEAKTWISLEEKFPEMGVSVEVKFLNKKRKELIGSAFYAPQVEGWLGDVDGTITHWRPKAETKN